MFQADIILELKKKLNEHGIILSFIGPFSQGIIEEIGDALKVYLESEENTRGNIYKVFSVFIEQTQNVKNYSFSLEDEKEREKVLSSGVMIIGEDDNKYFICSGNLIKEEHVDELKSRLDKIINSDKKELSKLYRKVLRKERKQESSGAGLGLIEISRKASEKIEYQFIDRDDDFYYFNMIVYV